jgi:hypothetical protein
MKRRERLYPFDQPVREEFVRVLFSCLECGTDHEARGPKVYTLLRRARVACVFCGASCSVVPAKDQGARGTP